LLKDSENLLGLPSHYVKAAWFLLVNPACLWLLKGQTLGKWLQGIRVVDSAGGAVSPVQAMVREVLNKLVLNALFSSLWSPYAGVVPSLISLVWCWVSPRGMTIWDTIAGTRVIEVRPRQAGG
jgi:uncharacterized RDD family membrane protein YckC